MKLKKKLAEDKNDKDIDHYKAKMNASYIIRYNHPYKIRWDLLVILLSIYNTILVPIEVSFNPDFFESNYFFWADRIIDIFFVLDIIINF